MPFIEFQQFGWNWLTASSSLIIVLNLWQLKSYTRQGVVIWQQKSVEAMSITFAVMIASILAGTLWYGVLISSLTIILAGCSFIPSLIILSGVFRYGKPSRKDKALLAVGIIAPFSFILPIEPAYVFAGFAAATLIPMASQLSALYRAGNRGVSQGELLFTYVVKNVAFLVFGLAIGDAVFIIGGAVWLVLSTWLFAKWYSLPTSPKGDASPN